MSLMRVAGFDWADVHKVRKLVSKSGGTAALEKYHIPYLDGMKAAGITNDEAEHLWVQCQKAGNYSFNQAHGAAYALHAYWTAYLKCHYSSVFSCMMANHENKEHFQRQILRDFQDQGGKLILLDPNRSQRKFSSPEANVILGGFETIKGVGPGHTEKILSSRAQRPYRDWMDFLTRCPTSLSQDLQAAGAHTEKIDLDSALVIAPWFADVHYLPIEYAAAKQRNAQPIQAIHAQMEMKTGQRAVRIVGRVTSLQLSTTKKQGKPGITSGLNERLLVTITDETGSIDVWFSGWKWQEIQRGRKPLRGPTEGIGNSVYVLAVISSDWSRLFGEEMICFRESKGIVHALTCASLRKEQKKLAKQKQAGHDLFTSMENTQAPPENQDRPSIKALAHLEAQLRSLSD